MRNVRVINFTSTVFMSKAGIRRPRTRRAALAGKIGGFRKNSAREFLRHLIEWTRPPTNTETHLVSGDIKSHLATASEEDLHVFGIPNGPDLPHLRSLVEETRFTCMFLMGSGLESALA
jgi:hypothetical protein